MVEESSSDYREIKYFTLANFFTSLNLLAGFFAILVLFIDLEERYLYSAVLICLSGLCDGADGYVARVRDEVSDFGKNLDSLVDMVSFGLSPALIFLTRYMGQGMYYLLPVCVFYLMAGAARLARFNLIDTADGKIKGLPITIAGLALALKVIGDFSLARNLSPLEDASYMLVLSLLMLGNFTLNKPGYRKKGE